MTNQQMTLVVAVGGLLVWAALSKAGRTIDMVSGAARRTFIDGDNALNHAVSGTVQAGASLVGVEGVDSFGRPLTLGRAVYEFGQWWSDGQEITGRIAVPVGGAR